MTTETEYPENSSPRSTPQHLELASARAHNYHPLPVVVADAEGVWVTDIEGRRYLDCLAVLGPELRTPSSRADGCGQGATRPADVDQPRLP